MTQDRETRETKAELESNDRLEFCDQCGEPVFPDGADDVDERDQEDELDVEDLVADESELEEIDAVDDQEGDDLRTDGGVCASDSEQARQKIQQAHQNAGAVHQKVVVTGITTLLNNPKQALRELAIRSLRTGGDDE